MEEKQLSLTPIQALDKNTADIVDEVIKENDVDKIKDLTALFNLNLKKKNMVRAYKLQSLLDNVQDKIVERFEKRPDEITNRELIEFLNATQNAIDKSNKSLENIGEGNIIQLNQQNNEINVNVNTSDNLDRESKAKVMNVIAEILNSAKMSGNDIIDIESEDITNILDIPEDEDNMSDNLESDDIEILIDDEGED